MVSIDEMVAQCEMRIRAAQREVDLLRKLPTDTFEHAMRHPPISAPRMIRGLANPVWMFNDERDGRFIVVTPDGATSRHRSYRAARREAKRRSAKVAAAQSPTSVNTKSEH